MIRPATPTRSLTALPAPRALARVRHATLAGSAGWAIAPRGEAHQTLPAKNDVICTLLAADMTLPSPTDRSFTPARSPLCRFVMNRDSAGVLASPRVADFGFQRGFDQYGLQVLSGSPGV